MHIWVYQKSIWRRTLGLWVDLIGILIEVCIVLLKFAVDLSAFLPAPVYSSSFLFYYDHHELALRFLYTSPSSFSSPWDRHGDDDIRHENLYTPTPTTIWRHSTTRYQKSDNSSGRPQRLTNRLRPPFIPFIASINISSTKTVSDTIHVVYIAIDGRQTRMLWFALSAVSARVIFAQGCFIIIAFLSFFTHHVWYSCNTLFLRWDGLSSRVVGARDGILFGIAFHFWLILLAITRS